MSRWSQGEADIEQLIKSGELQQISGSAADGRPVLEKATQKLDSARSVLEDGDPDSALSSLTMRRGLRRRRCCCSRVFGRPPLVGMLLCSLR